MEKSRFKLTSFFSPYIIEKASCKVTSTPPCIIEKTDCQLPDVALHHRVLGKSPGTLMDTGPKGP